MYKFIERVKYLYNCLEDRLSREIFFSQIVYELEPTWSNAIKLVNLNLSYCNALTSEEKRTIENSTEILKGLQNEGKKIIIYGTGFSGKTTGINLLYEGIDFWGFCNSSRAESFRDGLMGKPVIGQEYIIENSETCYILFATEAASQIITQLVSLGFPRDHVLFYFEHAMLAETNQYLQFPQLYRCGTALIDCGCFDCQDDYDFAEWCKGNYSKIISVEADPKNYAMCKNRIISDPIPNMQIVQAAIMDRVGTVQFGANGSAGSHVIGAPLDNCRGVIKQEVTVPCMTIDSLKEEYLATDKVGFIKMDIEGGEYAAIHGAKDTIIQDKPLLAICVYHRTGDMLAIMDYINTICSDYRFWLRREGDLVLYASVDRIAK